jgi:hypothetical protein
VEALEDEPDCFETQACERAIVEKSNLSTIDRHRAL